MPPRRLHLLQKDEHITHVLSDWNSGMTTVQIASSRDLNPVIVRKWLREEGVEISRGARPASTVEASCEICGGPFRKKSYSTKRTCGDACYRSLVASQKRGKPRPDLQTDEWKAIVSRSSKQMWAEGKFENRPWGHRTWPYRGINMRSSFETCAAQVLDSFGVAWLYEPQRFKLASGTYRPDFYLPELGVWVEIKGFLSESAEKKFEDFLSTGRTAFMVQSSNVIGIKSQMSSLLEALSSGGELEGVN